MFTETFLPTPDLCIHQIYLYNGTTTLLYKGTIYRGTTTLLFQGLIVHGYDGTNLTWQNYNNWTKGTLTNLGKGHNYNKCPQPNCTRGNYINCTTTVII